MISGFNFIKNELKDQEFTDPFRQHHVLVKLQGKEYNDWRKELNRRSTQREVNNEMDEEKNNFQSLGKRKIGPEGIDVEKILDVMKLKKIENKKMGFWENHSGALPGNDTNDDMGSGAMVQENIIGDINIEHMI